MQNINDTSTTADSQSNKNSEHRRKRIDRLKMLIVFIAILFLIMPTIFCIILGIQVHRLQQQMKDLIELHSQYGMTYEDQGSINYAYAAEKSIDTVDVPAIIPELSVVTKPTDIPNPTLNPQPTIKPDLTGNLNSTESNTKTVPDKNNSSVKDGKTEQKQGIYTGKKVYLTFDDGPSIYTDDILDILADYDVKATFFVIGKTDKKSMNLYKRIVKEGHTLGMHSYTHNYDKIYNSIEDFDKDFTKLWKLLYDTTGYKPSIYRFPGGSENMVNKNGMEDFIQYLNEHSVVYFDWNVLNGDATGVTYTKEQLIANVLGGVAAKDRSIVLMHDSKSKEMTVESLPGLLEELIAGGAQILPLDKEVPPIQMIKADSVK